MSPKRIQTFFNCPDYFAGPPKAVWVCACAKAYLVILAMSVDHPVLSIGADLKLKGGDMVRLLSFLRNGALCGDSCQHLQSMEIHLLATKSEDVLIVKKKKSINPALKNTNKPQN